MRRWDIGRELGNGTQSCPDPVLPCRSAVWWEMCPVLRALVGAPGAGMRTGDDAVVV